MNREERERLKNGLKRPPRKRLPPIRDFDRTPVEIGQVWVWYWVHGNSVTHSDPVVIERPVSSPGYNPDLRHVWSMRLTQNFTINFNDNLAGEFWRRVS